MKITAIRLDRMRFPLAPFRAVWDRVPRRYFDATLVGVDTDEGVTGTGSGDTMEAHGTPWPRTPRSARRREILAAPAMA